MLSLSIVRAVSAMPRVIVQAAPVRSIVQEIQHKVHSTQTIASMTRGRMDIKATVELH